MSEADPPRPVNITPFPNGEIGIVWEDGHESYYDSHALRCVCPCARCVDEMTGHKVLRDDAVPRNIRVLSFHPVGNYGIGIHWSDGHDTGIFTHANLRKLCNCKACQEN